MGNVEPVGEGVLELRILVCADLARVLHTARRAACVLVVGGSKHTQKSDMKRAKALAALLD